MIMQTQTLRNSFAVLALAALVSACGGGGGGGTDVAVAPPPPPPPPASSVQVFEQSAAPAKLSVWRFVQSDGAKLTLNTGVVPYDLNSALFTDYAFKLRTLYVPAGKQITYKTDGNFDYPVGTVMMKTFYYPKATGTDPRYTGVARATQTEQGSTIDLAKNRLMETRVLVLQQDGTWSGLPYVWDADQKDATLMIGGDSQNLELVPATGATEKFAYAVPNAQQCQECHSTASNGSKSGLLPIGPKARNLNRDYAYSAGSTKNQLTNLDDLKLLAGYTGIAAASKIVDWRDTSKAIDDRAKAYLDINCAGCHNPKGGAGQTGVSFDLATVGTLPTTSLWGVCNKPITGSSYAPSPYKYDIYPGRADLSILMYRLTHTDSAAVMPPVGREVNHTEGADMLRDWINQLTLPACI